MADDVPDFLPPPRRTEPLRAERGDLPPPPPPLPPAPPPVAPTAVKRGLLDVIGPRAARRPEPRFGIALAGAGSLMLVLGAVVISGDQLGGSGSGDGNQFPGVIISLAVIVAGVALTAKYRHGPLPAAGVAASALALPPFFFFLTFSETSPISFNTILLLSSVGWALAYVVGPGRGHGFYLGVALMGLWLWFIEATEDLFSAPLALFVSTPDSVGEILVGSQDSSSFTPPAGPDRTTIGTYTLLFGIVYTIAACVLDRREQRGAATPFTFAGLFTVVLGVGIVGDDLETVGTGIAFTLVGALFAYLGATAGRRATNWIGAALVFFGITLVLGDQLDDATAFGVAEIVLGGIVILVAHWISTQYREPPEVSPVLSRFYNSGSVQPSFPPPPPAGSVLG